MAVIDAPRARHFAEQWIAAWNAHDLDRVLAHYDEQVSFRSPFIATIAGIPSGQLTGKAALHAYWSKALAMVPTLRFELVDVLAGVDTLTLYYRGHRGLVAETFRLDDHDKVVDASACYSTQT